MRGLVEIYRRNRSAPRMMRRARRRRAPVPAARRGGRDRHEPQSLRLCRQVADGRSRRHLRRRAHAGRRRHHARLRLHRRARATTWSASCSPTRMRTTSAPCPICGRACAARSMRRPSPPRCCAASCARPELARRGRRSPRCRCPAASQLAPFDLELVTLTHSIPEPNALVIRTPLGTVLHTGDWKLDPEPLVGDGDRRGGAAPPRRGGRAGHGLRFDQRAGARAHSGSEAEVRDSLD